MRYTYFFIILCLLLLPYAFAQIPPHQFELIRPDGSNTGYKTECADYTLGGICSLENPEGQKHCTQEGMYKYRLAAYVDYTTNHAGFGSNYYQNSHDVLWDNEKWCRGEGDTTRVCLNYQVEWNTQAGRCCGASYSRGQGGSTCRQQEIECTIEGYTPLSVPQDYPYSLVQDSPYYPQDTSAIDPLISQELVYLAPCDDPLTNPKCELKPWIMGDVIQIAEDEYEYWEAIVANTCRLDAAETDGLLCERREIEDLEDIPEEYHEYFEEGWGSWTYRFFKAEKTCTYEEICQDTTTRRDCGGVSNGYICGETAPLSFEFGNLATNKGDIYEYACANASVVSDGTQFLSCGDTQQLYTSLPKLTVTQITRGSTTHGYLCGETNPGKSDGYARVVECVGRGAAMSTIAGGVAITGENISPDLLYRTTVSGESLTKVQAQYNFAGAQGSINLRITPEWDGDDTEPRTFLSIDDQAAGGGNSIRIRKSGTSLVCSYNTNSVSFSLTDYETEDGPIDVTYRWIAGGQFTCTYKGEQKTANAASAIDAIHINLADHPNTGEEANAQINIEIYSSVAPTTYYCADNGLFLKNLDNLPHDIGYQTCEVGAGLLWTGTKCCSEAEDIPEYYNDIGGIAACYNGNGRVNGETEPTANDSIIVVDGRWRGCNLAENNPSLLTIKDTHTNAQLVTDTTTCQAYYDIGSTDNNWVCTTQGNWMYTPSKLPHIPKSVPYTNRYPYNESRHSECVGLDSCWNGTQPIANQINDSTTRNFEGYRCINGQWGIGDAKKTWDRSSRGYCPQQTDCLVHPLGDFNKNYKPETYVKGQSGDSPACIADGQSIGAYYCDAGAWTTRTKWVGLQLMNLGESSTDYSLFCGPWEDVLNFVDYKDITNARAIQEYIGKTCLVGGAQTDCVNGFCAVKYDNDNKVAFGTSLNIPIDDAQNSFLLALGESAGDCSGQQTPGDAYRKCQGTANVYYNNDLNSVIYSTTQLAQVGKQTLRNTQFLPKINTTFEALTAFSDRPLLKAYKGFLSESSLYDNWYKAKKANKNYFGYLGTHQWNSSYLNYVAVQHQGFPAQDPDGKDPCEMAQAKIENDRPRDCAYDGNLRFIAYTTEQFGNVKETWRDLTAKLRI